VFWFFSFRATQNGITEGNPILLTHN
jgi:hypothetical protein